MDDLLKKIVASAEEVEVPESLKPENIMDTVNRKRRKSSRRRVVYWSRTLAAAAVLVICVSVAWWAIDTRMVSDSSSAEAPNSSEAAGQKAAEEAALMPHIRQNAGELYTLAEDYEDVMEVIRQNDIYYELDILNGDIVRTEGAVIEEAAVDEAGASVSISSSLIQDLQQTMEKASDYSETNLQTQGVDESDIVKTDGSYIYVARENRIYLVDIQGGRLELLSEITLEESVLELYVDNNQLIAVVQKQDTSMEAAASKEPAIEEICIDTFEINTTAVTFLQTYDITDRSNPKLQGEVMQDGYYHTSRKIGDIVYLFTNYNIPFYRELENTEESGVIPLVNGQKIAADCIYLPKQGGRGLLVSAVNMDKPDEIVDNIFILHDSVDIYVSTKSLYLYNTVYQQEKQLTQIAKFRLEDGYINAVAAANAEGRVTDTFAIQEENDCLRLLTTREQLSANQEMSGSLYLFDEKLNLTGQLHDIAPGEQIYAARYLEDTAYFITYRNTDPLFAADISNPAKPVLIGEVEMTGFSDYLHFWNEDLLLGIGYETDPNNGERKGIKLTMFDISDSADLKIKGNKVIKGCTYCPSLDNYKSILADGQKNLIGITTAEYHPEEEYTYELFAWKEDSFCELMQIDLPDNTDPARCRGIYSGNTFYLINEEGIVSYSMEDYCQEKELKLTTTQKEINTQLKE